ncbi:TNT antitoxin family protein [Mycobacterium sp. NBC_00419]|uniref:Imm61 family immunity protein n=1 Tax=Mycobacterium sp. NBC_00419 TaxID=2975989 RepID=UPI002E1FE479
MEIPKFDDELVAWSSGAGMSSSEFESTSAAVFSNGGGEYRYYVRYSADRPGWLDVTRASRADPERIVFSANDIGTVERYLWVTFGADNRTVRRQFRLDFPMEPADIAKDYSLSRCNRGFLRLVDPRGQAIVETRDSILGAALLVMMSYYLQFSVAELRGAFLDASGSPVFPIKVPRSVTTMANKRFQETLASAEGRYSLGVDLKTSGHFLSIPVSNRIVEYNEHYALSAEQHERFLDDWQAAVRFADECRARRHDDLLIYQPSDNRGEPL